MLCAQNRFNRNKSAVDRAANLGEASATTEIFALFPT